MPKVLCLDPGESTGWFFYDGPMPYVFNNVEPNVQMGTVKKFYLDIGKLIDILEPDIVIFETFNLYPGSAKSLIWNSFYPCEVIGIIKYVCMSKCIELVAQAPPVKGYSGGLDDLWLSWRKGSNYQATEHTKDAYLHFRYYNKVLLNKEKRKPPR